jgi:hypothetical protein
MPLRCSILGRSRSNHRSEAAPFETKPIHRLRVAGQGASRSISGHASGRSPPSPACEVARTNCHIAGSRFSTHLTCSLNLGWLNLALDNVPSMATGGSS